MTPYRERDGRALMRDLLEQTGAFDGVYLSTLPEARGQGHAGALLDWLLAEARARGCDEIHLDSGVQAERWDAHRLYLNHGYAITSHHFARPA